MYDATKSRRTGSALKGSCTTYDRSLRNQEAPEGKDAETVGVRSIVIDGVAWERDAPETLALMRREGCRGGSRE